MKKLIALFFVLVFSFCIATVSLAASEKGVYNSTKQFIATLDEHDFNYSYLGVNSKDFDVVTVTLTGENTSVLVRFFFNDNEEDCAIRVWYIIEYDEALEIAVCQAVNTLNQQYRFTCFYADTDYTVSASMDLIFHDGDDIGWICYTAMHKVANVCDTVYPVLLPFNK
jgi:uncharacterized membrane protein YciS (DUF1049 family)